MSHGIFSRNLRSVSTTSARNCGCLPKKSFTDGTAFLLDFELNLGEGCVILGSSDMMLTFVASSIPQPVMILLSTKRTSQSKPELRAAVLITESCLEK